MMFVSYNTVVNNPIPSQYGSQLSPAKSQSKEMSNLMCNMQTLPQEQYLDTPKPMAPQLTEHSNLAFSVIQPCISTDAISPPRHHPPNVPVSICRVDLMTIEQTGNWISTLGRFRGWKEAYTYGQNFKEQSITGSSLSQITPKMLEETLGISDQSHRVEIFITIQNLFCLLPLGNSSLIHVPNPLYNITLASSCESLTRGSVQVLHSDCTSTINFRTSPKDEVRRHLESECESSYSRVCASSCPTDQLGDFMSESAYRERTAGTAYNITNAEGDGLSKPNNRARKSDVVMTDKLPDNFEREETGSIRSIRTAKGSIRSTRKASYKKLILTLKPDQIPEHEGRSVDLIRRRFEQFDAFVEVIPEEDPSNRYLVVFENSEMAQDAFHQADDIGYELAKKWPARPNPNRPILYKAMSDLLIREGKAFSGQVMGTLKKDETVYVNQLKGRRARLIRVENGETITRGWVSVHSSDGEPLLMQVAEL